MAKDRKTAGVDPGVDKFDLAILSEISTNADVSASRLSEIVNLSRTSVSKRISNLRSRGIVSPPLAELNYELMGFSIRTVIHVVSPSKTSFELLDLLLLRPEVLSVSVVIGEGVMLIENITKNRAHLHRFLNWLMDNVDTTTTHLVLREHRSTMSLQERLRLTDEFLATPDDRVD